MPRIAIVTGGTRGIGAATSQALQAQGYTVAACFGGNAQAAEDFAKATGIKTYQFDVADFQACQDAVSTIEQELGPPDILVNNAGITRDAMLQRMTLEQWQQVVDTNLTSCFHMCKATIEGMRERKFGRLINIASINAVEGQLGQANYAASKAGVIGFTKSLAREGARYGITANAITPGYIETDMVRAIPEPVLEKIIAKIPVGRLGQPEEIARAVVFIASDEAGFMTGSVLAINGGQSMY